MRYVAIILLLFTNALSSVAQPTEEQPARFHMDFGFGLPSNNFRSGKNDNYIIGQSTQGVGFGIKFSTPVAGNFYLGFCPSMIAYNLKEDIMKDQVLKMYHNNDMYSEASVGFYNLYMTLLGGQMSWVYNTNLVTFEPFMELGVVICNLEGDSVSVNRKRINSNYADNIKIIQIRPKISSAMYGMLGLRLNKKLAKRFGVSLSACYTITGSMQYRFRTELTDYLDKKHDLGSFTQKNSFRSVQFETGVQFYFFRSKKRLHL